jgi:hypothetical protein
LHRRSFQLEAINLGEDVVALSSNGVHELQSAVT